MVKLFEDLRIGALGAAAGLFSASLTLIIALIDDYYDYLSRLDESNYDVYVNGLRDLWWLPVVVWHVLLSIVSSLVVHRYLATRIRSPFLLWQAVGVTSLLGWGLTFFLFVSLECASRGNLRAFQHELNSLDLSLIAKSVATIFLCNVFFGSIMNASSQLYAEHSGTTQPIADEP